MMELVQGAVRGVDWATRTVNVLVEGAAGRWVTGVPMAAHVDEGTVAVGVRCLMTEEVHGGGAKLVVVAGLGTPLRPRSFPLGAQLPSVSSGASEALYWVPSVAMGDAATPSAGFVGATPLDLRSTTVSVVVAMTCNAAGRADFAVYTRCHGEDTGGATVPWNVEVGVARSVVFPVADGFKAMRWQLTHAEIQRGRVFGLYLVRQGSAATDTLTGNVYAGPAWVEYLA